MAIPCFAPAPVLLRINGHHVTCLVENCVGEAVGSHLVDDALTMINVFARESSMMPLWWAMRIVAPVNKKSKKEWPD